MHISTYGDDTYDVGRPDMPVTQTSVDPFTGSTEVHVTGIQPITSFYASQGLDSTGTASAGSSGGSSDSGFFSTLGKLFGGSSGAPPPNAYGPAPAAAGIPSWALIGVPIILGGALLVVAGSSRRRPAYAGYRRRTRRSRR